MNYRFPWLIFSLIYDESINNFCWFIMSTGRQERVKICVKLCNLWFLFFFISGCATYYSQPHKIPSRIEWLYSITDDLTNPTGICVNEREEILVSDTGNRRIVKFSKDGKVLSDFGGQPIFKKPKYIRYTGLTLYVVDYENRSIEKFDRRGNFIETIPIDSKTKPSGIAISSAGDIYVSDVGNDRIVTIRANRLQSHIIGKGELEEPNGLFFTRSGNLLICDSGNSRVAVYDRFGNFIFAIDDSLYKPKDICTDRYGNIFVTDVQSNKISIFSSECEWLKSVKVNSPTGIVTDRYDQLYIVNNEDSKVEVYKIFYPQ